MHLFVVSMPRNTGATPVVQTPLPSFTETFSKATGATGTTGATETPKCKDFIIFFSKQFICLCIAGYFNWKILNFCSNYISKVFLLKEKDSW